MKKCAPKKTFLVRLDGEVAPTGKAAEIGRFATLRAAKAKVMELVLEFEKATEEWEMGSEGSMQFDRYYKGPLSSYVDAVIELPGGQIIYYAGSALAGDGKWERS